MSSKCPAISAYSHRATDLSETSCKFHFNGTTPFAESCSSPFLDFSLLVCAFPSAVTKQSFSPPCIISVSSEAHGSIRPSWEIQIVTGVMWTGSLHMPRLAPPSNTQSSANHRLRIYLYDFHSALCHLFTLPLAEAKDWIRRIHRKRRQENHSISQSAPVLHIEASSCKTPHPKLVIKQRKKTLWWCQSWSQWGKQKTKSPRAFFFSLSNLGFIWKNKWNCFAKPHCHLIWELNLIWPNDTPYREH